MTAALGIVYRTIATHLAQKAGFTKTVGPQGLKGEQGDKGDKGELAPRAAVPCSVQLPVLGRQNVSRNGNHG